MTKKAMELKRGDRTPIGEVLEKCNICDVDEQYRYAVLFRDGTWRCFDHCEDIKVYDGPVKARDLRVQQVVYLQGRERPTRVTQIAGSDDANGFLVAGFSQGPGMYTSYGPKDWIRVSGNHEFQVVK